MSYPLTLFPNRSDTNMDRKDRMFQACYSCYLSLILPIWIGSRKVDKCCLRYCLIVERTRQVSSMIHSARPTASLAVNMFSLGDLFCLLDFDGRTTCAKTINITGHDCGSAAWIKIAQTS